MLGACRAGIKVVILPKENQADLDELPDEVRSKLQVHLVERLEEVLAIALTGVHLESGKLVFDKPSPPAAAQPGVLISQEKIQEKMM